MTMGDVSCNGFAHCAHFQTCHTTTQATNPLLSSIPPFFLCGTIFDYSVTYIVFTPIHAGAFLPFAVTAMAWRLAVLLPDQPERGMEPSPSGLDMSAAPSSYYPSEQDPVTKAAGEKTTVLY